MSFVTDDLMNWLLDQVWGSGDPVTWYIALFEALPSPDGTGGTEASYTGYARSAVANDATEWPAAAAAAKQNANAIPFGVAGSGPTDIVGFGFYDDPTATGASPLWAVIDVTGAPVTINNGADVTFPPASINLTRCA